MSKHSAFLLGRALAEVRRSDPDTADQLLRDVGPLDIAAVLRGMEDAASRQLGERGNDMALLVAGVRAS